MSDPGRSDRRPPPAQTVGERIAFYRRRAGLSQAELAGRLGRSSGYLANIEQGSRPLDRLPLLRRLADALGVTVADIHPDAAYPAGPVIDSDPTGMLALLAGHPHLHRQVAGPLPPLEEAAASVAALEGLDDEALFAALVELLPALDAAAAAAKGRARPRWEALRSAAYQSAAAALARAGEHPGSWVAAERAVCAGARCGDDRLVAAALLAAAKGFLDAGRLIQAHAAATTAAELAGGDSPKRSALAGTAHLVLAEVAAGRADRRSVDEHLVIASDLAGQLGDDHYNESGFSPTAVAITAMRVFVALEDAGRARAIAEDLDPTELPDPSRAAYLVTYARAELLRAQPRHALALLVEADRLAPDLAAADADMRAAIAALSGFSSRVRGGTSDLARLRQKAGNPPTDSTRSP